MAFSMPKRTTNNTCQNTSDSDELRPPPTLPPPSALLRTWSEHAIGTLLDVWSMLPTYEMQIDAVISLIDVNVCGEKVLLIVNTGAGNSHVMHTTSVMIGSVCLIIMPLLALSADQAWLVHFYTELTELTLHFFV
jgi:hypothetical protein